MATSISTDSDLLGRGYLLRNEAARLTPPEWQGIGWTPWHETAWREVLRNLADRPTPITEADLADSSELLDAVLHHVLWQAYRMAGEEKQAEFFRDRYTHMMATIRPTLVSGGEASGWGRAVPLFRT